MELSLSFPLTKSIAVQEQLRRHSGSTPSYQLQYGSLEAVGHVANPTFVTTVVAAVDDLLLLTIEAQVCCMMILLLPCCPHLAASNNYKKVTGAFQRPKGS